MRKITPRQLEVLDMVKSHVKAHGYPPTFREIGDELGIGSTNGVNDHLRALELKGYITRSRTKTRSIRVLEVGPLVTAEHYEAAEELVSGDDEEAVIALVAEALAARERAQ